MSREEKKQLKNNGARVTMSIIFMVFGVICFYALKNGFSAAVLLLGVAAFGIGVFNVFRVVRSKAVKKESKSAAATNDYEF